MATNPALYPYRIRRNKDGSYDSVCSTCYTTIARSRPKADLATQNRAHICDSAFLADRGHLTRPESLSVLP